MKSIKGLLASKFPQYLDSYDEENELLTKWNWDYKQYLYFISELLPWLRENPSWGLSILCSHPHCFTNGSGLQKERGKPLEELVQFDNSMELPFPLHQIKRGGGLTFHYPGQVIYYPMFHMNHLKSSPPRMMLKMLSIAKEILEKELAIDSLDYEKLLGLWYQSKRKIASFGMGLEYYVSIHGMAFNYQYDKQMFDALKRIHPCGLQGETYCSLEEISNIEKLSKEQFSKIFHQKFSSWVKNRN